MQIISKSTNKRIFIMNHMISQCSQEFESCATNEYEGLKDVNKHKTEPSCLQPTSSSTSKQWEIEYHELALP
jgi:hypothetical protein